jgi:hypothetical protein
LTTGNVVSVGEDADPVDHDAASDGGAGSEPRVERTDWTIPVSVGVMQLAGLASIGAGAIHAGVAGLHADTTTLSRLFVGCAIAQIAVGLFALVKGGRIAAALTVAVNVAAVATWATTRLSGISWIDGLEHAESAQFTDSACAALGGIAAVSAAIALAWRHTRVSTVRLGVPALSVGIVALAAMLTGVGHVHGHGDEAAPSHDEGAETVAGEGASAEPAEHTHTDEEATATGTQTAALADADADVVWPRAWNPQDPIDLSGVPGVTPEQQLRATALIQNTLERLPQFADVDSIGALGYRSIGDAVTGHEHYVNYGYIADDHFLDPDHPESLVYRVNGTGRTLVSAMFIASQTRVDDPALLDYGGPLMTWHVHQNLCWAGGDNGPRVVAVTDAAGNCPPGSVNAGGENPMVHVWIVPHECGPFAALEGHGAGQAGEGERTDQCAHGHSADGTDVHSDDAGTGAGDTGAAALAGGAASAEPAAVTPVPYDPERPIDLSGTPGVTPQQQAFAENLIANTLLNLPQWSDPAVAEAAGFRSIGDGATGHEHFIQWSWIDDDVFLDPNHPESLVYEPQPDGSRRLVSAMYMMPASWELSDVPDWGGPLMQWHIHNNLCFDVSDPDAPRVGGLTDAQGGCTAPLEKFGESPMIHVWITAHPCGPFASLEGIGAGQIADGEERLCDHAHGG